VLTDEAGIFIHHPTHHLRGGANIGSGHVIAWTNILPHGSYPTAAQFFLFTDRQCGRIDHDTALTTTQRNVRHGAFPGHPRRQRADGIHGLSWVEANAALVGSASIIMLNAEALK